MGRAERPRVERPRYHNLKGGLAAAIVMGSWIGCLILLLTREVTGFAWWIPLGMAVQTFLYTGLFITAHDAMHGTVLPRFPRVNRAIGTAAVLLYALFSFKKLKKSHWEHHDHPASQDDPDFHDGKHPGVLRWYLHFMVGYVTIGQLIGMAIAFNVMQYGLGVAVENLILFWIVPSLLSTWQLFYFGTVQPHRETEEGYTDEHRARSSKFSPWLSFLTCYHFGYHWEHHDRPDLPWWSLPRYHRKRMQGGA